MISPTVKRVGLRVLRAGLRRISSTRALPRQPKRADGEPTAIIRVGDIRVLARHDPALNLPEQATAFRTRVLDALAGAGIPAWTLPTGPNERTVIGVAAEHRAAVGAAITKAASASWYWDGLTERRGQSSRLSRPTTAPAPHSPGILLWEFVFARADSTFVAAEQQGVEIHFWDLDDAGDLQSGVRNGVAELLPAAVVAEVAPSGAASTPVVGGGRRVDRVAFPIDLVYTWVDGADEGWLATLAEATGAADPGLFTERAAHQARFADHDELRYSLRSVEQFAPWINHIWIVTAGQVPAWLAEHHPQVSIITHSQIWPDDSGLPTFNSHAIEACLHRIPGLSEHYLYLNDDMIFGRPLAPEVFFHPGGIGKIFQSRALVDLLPVRPGEIASTTAAKNARRALADRYGVTFSRKFFHTAVALRVSKMMEMEREFPDLFERTRRSTFRSVTDIAASGSFYLNFAAIHGYSVPARIRYDYFDPSQPDHRLRLRNLLNQRALDSLCINDGSSDESDAERIESDRVIRQFLDVFLPVPSSMEKGGPGAGADLASAAGTAGVDTDPNTPS